MCIGLRCGVGVISAHLSEIKLNFFIIYVAEEVKNFGIILDRCIMFKQLLLTNYQLRGERHLNI